MSGLLILVVLMPIPFAIGLGGIKFRRLPLIAGALLCLAYIVFLIGYGTWTAMCPRCNEGELLREGAFVTGALVYGTFLIVLLSTMAIGALIARAVRRGILHPQPPSSRAGDKGGDQVGGND